MKSFLLFLSIILLQACSSYNQQNPVKVEMPIVHNVGSEDFNVNDEFTPSSKTIEKLNIRSEQFKYNYDYQARDRLLRLQIDWKAKENEVSYFENLDIKMFEKIVLSDFINPYDNQNNSPLAKDIFLFMSKYPQVIAAGYIVGPTREDYRITIDELSVSEEYVTNELSEDFKVFCESADEIHIGSNLYSWWD